MEIVYFYERVYVIKDKLDNYTLEGAEITSYQWTKQPNVGHPG